ncbi:hypothetical protein ACFY30_31985 [Streptomyces sp. NPDC000345]|uniref:hypothetical protein n=1 Tax=Streptomyces sp. NPDC000345 TaxID=3364537 RepID=UPI0036C2B82C
MSVVSSPGRASATARAGSAAESAFVRANAGGTSPRTRPAEWPGPGTRTATIRAPALSACVHDPQAEDGAGGRLRGVVRCGGFRA